MKHLQWAFEQHGASFDQLYHYSGSKHTVLKTRNAQGTHLSPEKLQAARESMEIHHDPGTYAEHISFFLEPVPLDKLGGIFGAHHHFWYPGHEIYEHVVDIASLPSFRYRVVETPLANDMFYKVDWDKLDDAEQQTFFQKLAEAQKAHGEIGSTVAQLRSCIRKFAGLTRKAYLALPGQPNWSEIKNKYAATVPHVMLYPEGGEVTVTDVEKVVVQ